MSEEKSTGSEPEKFLDLKVCIPADKSDFAAVRNAYAAGYPEINSILPELLEWVQDPNWPVAQELYMLLAAAGEEIIPLIRHIFESDDEMWHCSVLRWIGPHMDASVWRMIKPDVEQLSLAPTMGEAGKEDVKDAAQDLLEFWSS